MKRLIFLLACLLLFNCEDNVDDTNDGIVYNGFVELPIDNYYSSEIFPESYLGVYGLWKCYQISGGWAGDIVVPDPDIFFIMEPYGIFGIIENDTLRDIGKIEIGIGLYEALFVRFISDDSTKLFLYDLEKYIYLLGEDTLLLEAPCCDRYNYHFVREE